MESLLSDCRANEGGMNFGSAKFILSRIYSGGRRQNKNNQKSPDLGRGIFVLNTLFWRSPTLPLRVPSALVGLTAVFGMRTGVAPLTNHQNKTFNSRVLFGLTFFQTSERNEKFYFFISERVMKASAKRSEQKSDSI